MDPIPEWGEEDNSDYSTAVRPAPELLDCSLPKAELFASSIIKLCGGLEEAVFFAGEEASLKIPERSPIVYIPSAIDPFSVGTMLSTIRMPNQKIRSQREGGEAAYGTFPAALEGRNPDNTPHTYFFAYSPRWKVMVDYLNREGKSILPSLAQLEYKGMLEKELSRRGFSFQELCLPANEVEPTAEQIDF